MMTSWRRSSLLGEYNGIIEQQSLFKWQKRSDLTQNTYAWGKLIAKIFNMTIKWEWTIDRQS